jgi:beta-lactam-binding protein with PASTA domain
VVGLDADGARAVLSRSGLRVNEPDLAGGVVVTQYPEVGLRVPPGTVVTLWFGAGPGSAGVREPRRPQPDPSVRYGEAALPPESAG